MSLMMPMRPKIDVGRPNIDFDAIKKAHAAILHKLAPLVARWQ